jgi:hypothetical protein
VILLRLMRPTGGIFTLIVHPVNCGDAYAALYRVAVLAKGESGSN